MMKTPRKNTVRWRLAAALALLLLLPACGKKGPLYHPGNPPPQQSGFGG